MKLLKAYLFSRTAHHTYLTVGANVVYGLLTIWFFILASRALGPEQFGLLSIILAVYTISFDFFSLGTSQALTRFVSVYLGKNKPNQAHVYAQTIFRFRLGEAIFLFALAFFVGKVLANFYHQPSLVLPTALGFTAAGVILVGDYFASLLRAYDNFALASVLVIINAVSKIVILILILTLLPSLLMSNS